VLRHTWFWTANLFLIEIGLTGTDLGIEQLLTALLEEVRRRVRNGQLTERGLARLTGVSQPHLHHILKGKRGITPNLADRMMDVLSLDLAALIELGYADVQAAPPQPGATSSLGASLPAPNRTTQASEPTSPIHEPPVLVPIFDGLIGPGHPSPLPFRPSRYLPVPRRELPPDVALLAARMAFDPQAGPEFVSNDLIVIAAAPLPAIFADAMAELSWVLDDSGSWRVELPPHPGWNPGADSVSGLPAQGTPTSAEQRDLFDREDPWRRDAATASAVLVGVVVLCIRRMGPLRLPLLDRDSEGRLGI
jgi:hypothetical protein